MRSIIIVILLFFIAHEAGSLLHKTSKKLSYDYEEELINEWKKQNNSMTFEEWRIKNGKR